MTAERPMRSWGHPGVRDLDRIVVVSPHLDDAVLGCGLLLDAVPGTTVLTVFTGAPESYPDPMRPWDVECGFGPGDDVMTARRAEDVEALAVTGSVPVHLGLVEYSYRPGDAVVPVPEIASALAAELDRINPTLVLIPFGLANPDHGAVHEAALAVRAADGGAREWWCYEEAGYKHIPGMLAWRVAGLFRSEIWPTPVVPPSVKATAVARKAEALACYRSQVRALDLDWDLPAKGTVPEQYWRLSPPPAGWEGLSAGA
jgi:LmbE family N-acetylglucosaminyl deacetylase